MKKILHIYKIHYSKWIVKLKEKIFVNGNV